MTGDARRDNEATSHRWGGTDQPLEDEYAAHQRAEAEKAELERAWAEAHEEAEYAAHRRREAERQASIDNGRAIVRAHWLDTISGHRLHYAELTDQQAADIIDYGQLGLAEEGTDDSFRLACGRVVTYITIPGVFSRLGVERCARCCKAVGLRRGTGSPKNDDACRAVLGMDQEDT